MTGIPENIERLWDILRLDKVTLPGSYWDAWESSFLGGLDDLHLSVENFSKTVSFPVEQELICRIEEQICLFHQIKGYPVTVSGKQVLNVTIHPAVRVLLAHYLGNGLQKMLWALEEQDKNACVIVLAAILDIRTFIKKLHSETDVKDIRPEIVI